MKKIITTLLITFSCMVVGHAQTFLEHLQKKQQGQGVVTVTQSKELDYLIDGVKAKPKLDKDSLNKDSINQKEVAKDSTTTEKPHRRLVRKEKETTDENTENVKVDTRKKVMRGSHKVNGYRVQIFSGGNTRADRTKAHQAMTKAKQNYPSLPAYTHFFSPHWKCLVGNFIDYKEADKVLKQMKALGFKQAIIVKSKISVQ